MLKKLAKTIAVYILPLVLEELILKLEEVLKEDINNDGKIGK